MRIKKMFAFAAFIFILGVYAAYQGFKYKLPILMYHHILSDAENVHFTDNSLVVSLENFESQMKYLYDSGYTTITSDQLIDFLYNNKPLPEKSVMLTFDDGYYSNIIYAYPILKKYNFRAIIFPITSYITDNKIEFNANELVYLNRPEMAGTDDVFEYASHTDNMHYLIDDKSALQIESKEHILDDLAKSFELPGISNAVFSYPYGKYNDLAIECLKELGVKAAVTVKTGYVRQNDNPYELNRLDIYRDMSLKRFIGIVD